MLEDEKELRKNLSRYYTSEKEKETQIARIHMANRIIKKY